MTEIVTRFAPSPTGRLHVGNIRAALINWLFARKSAGRFLLRLDDTDAARSRAEYAEAIIDDLAWLGLSPDGTVKQSERTALYEASFERLRETGWIYPAYETAEDLDLKRKVQAARGLPPVYDRAALKLTDTERAKLEADGVKPHWRFRLDLEGPASWRDLVRGEAHIDPASLSDPVVRRADGSWLYMLPSVIDDNDMGVTHVVRGEDHVTNSGVQLQMFAALGAEPPEFAHVSLLTGAEGDKLSKRAGALGLDALREMGVEPVTIAALLARIGTSQPVEAVMTLGELAEGFSFDVFGRAPARFDPADLTPLNAKLLHEIGYPEVADRLPAGMDEAAWHVIRPNVQTIGDVAALWHVVTGPVKSTAAPEDAAYLAEAAAVLADMAWGEDIWPRWTAALKAASGRKGRALFLPLRQALTGEAHGPEMAGLVQLIGRDKVLARLEVA